MLAQLEVLRLVKNGVVETGLAVAVAVEIAEPDVMRVGYFDGPRKRLVGTDDAIAVKIGEGDVVRRINFNRQAEAAFAALFFRLQRIEAPVGRIPHLDFVADMMLARNLIGATFRLGVGNAHASLGKSRGRPNIQERAAAAISNPEAGELAVPMAVGVGIGGMIVVIRILTGAVRQGR